MLGTGRHGIILAVERGARKGDAWLSDTLHGQPSGWRYGGGPGECYFRRGFLQLLKSCCCFKLKSAWRYPSGRRGHMGWRERLGNITTRNVPEILGKVSLRGSVVWAEARRPRWGSGVTGQTAGGKQDMREQGDCWQSWSCGCRRWSLAMKLHWHHLPLASEWWKP